MLTGKIDSLHDRAVFAPFSKIFKKKRQGWSNYKMVTQFSLAKSRERLDGNTAEAVPKSPLAEGSQQGFIHRCKRVVPCERVGTTQRRMLQEDGCRALRVTSSLSCWLSPCPLSSYIPSMDGPNCAPYLLGAQGEVWAGKSWLLLAPPAIRMERAANTKRHVSQRVVHKIWFWAYQIEHPTWMVLLALIPLSQLSVSTMQEK